MVRRKNHGEMYSFDILLCKLNSFPFVWHAIDYFGRLAAISGIEHNFIYLGDDTLEYRDKRVTIAHTLPYLMARTTARRMRLCPPIDIVVDAVRQVVQRWHNRCRLTSA